MENETTINEVMEFLQENMVTKIELKKELDQIRGEMATKDDIKNMATKDDIAELREEMHSEFDKLEKRTKQDVDALAHDYIGLEGRVAILEGQV